MSIAIIGGGAAGFFAASNCHCNDIVLLEKTRKSLAKVKISGGGRCNVTHACLEPADLVKNYPRGAKELLGAFSRFQPRDAIEWFKERGVELKIEPDGRVFPVTDDSQTIIDCFLEATQHVDIRYGQNVADVEQTQEGFIIHLKKQEPILVKKILLATGGAPAGHVLAKKLGHTVVDPVPSLFTFNIPDSPLEELSGVSVDPVTVSLPKYKSRYEGPMLITHWGFSGPAVLKLSAFCARKLHASNYNTTCQIDWVPKFSNDQLREMIAQKKKSQSTRNYPLVPLPKSLWKKLMDVANIRNMPWSNLSKKEGEILCEKLKRDRYSISGKTTYKQEFVTCGGVKLSEVNFQTMESKIVPGLYFAGEILDIDGITGGFNFQAAWTTAYIADL